jgi:hypothetical protein
MDWSVQGGALQQPMASAEFAAFAAGAEERKAEQGRSLGQAPVLLAFDVTGTVTTGCDPV